MRIVRRTPKTAGRSTLSLENPEISTSLPQTPSKPTHTSPHTGGSSSCLPPISSSPPAAEWIQPLLRVNPDLTPLCPVPPELVPGTSKPPIVVRRNRVNNLNRLLGRRIQTLEPTSELQEQKLAAAEVLTSVESPHRCHPSTTDVLSALSPIPFSAEQQIFSIQALGSQNEADALPLPDLTCDTSLERRRSCPPSMPPVASSRRSSARASLLPLSPRDLDVSVESDLSINSHAVSCSESYSDVCVNCNDQGRNAKLMRKPSVTHPQERLSVPAQRFHPAMNAQNDGYSEPTDLNSVVSSRRLVALATANDACLVQKAQQGSLLALGCLLSMFYGSLTAAFSELNFSGTGHISWREWIAGMRRIGLRIQTKQWRMRCGCRLADVWFRQLSGRHSDFIIQDEFISRCSREDVSVCAKNDPLQEWQGHNCALAYRFKAGEAHQTLEEKVQGPNTIELNDFDKLVEESAEENQAVGSRLSQRIHSLEPLGNLDGELSSQQELETTGTKKTLLDSDQAKIVPAAENYLLDSIAESDTCPREEVYPRSNCVDESSGSSLSSSDSLDESSALGNLSKIFKIYTKTNKGDKKRGRRRALSFLNFWRFCQDYNVGGSKAKRSEWLQIFNDCESLERDFLHGNGHYNVGSGLGLDFFKMCVHIGCRKLR